MDLLLILGCVIATVFIVYNVICYKNKKTVYMLNDKYIILNPKYYRTQFIFGLSNSFSLFILYLVCNEGGIYPPIVMMLTIIIFWGINYILTFYAKKKGYISTKEESQ